jgi:hypothetical protein
MSEQTTSPSPSIIVQKKNQPSGEIVFSGFLYKGKFKIISPQRVQTGKLGKTVGLKFIQKEMSFIKKLKMKLEC